MVNKQYPIRTLKLKSGMGTFGGKVSFMHHPFQRLFTQNELFTYPSPYPPQENEPSLMSL